MKNVPGVPSPFSNGAGTAHHSKPHAAARFAHPVRNVHALGIEAGMSVVDFGAGGGAYVFAIAERLEGAGHIFAIDIQRDLLRRIHTEAARRGHKNIEVLWSDLEGGHASKLAEHSIDVVLMSNLLFQLSDKAVVFHEAHRVLRPRGKLVLIDWSDSFRHMGPHPRDVVKKEEALSLARNCGFELAREFDAGAHHYGLMLRPIQKRA